MALGIATTSEVTGDILPRIEYDAKAGRAFRVDRTQDSNEEWITYRPEMPLPLTFLMDLEHIEVGWIKLDKVAGVDFKMVYIDGDMGPRPPGVNDKGQPLYKQGFRVKVYSQKLFGGVRVWAHTAKCVIQQIDMLHNQFMAALAQNAGKVPVVTIVSVMSVKSGQSTNYAPVISLDKWSTRPDGLSVPNKPAVVKATLAPVSAGSTVVAPPPAAVADDTPEEF
jgi:hypothetical protein